MISNVIVRESLCYAVCVVIGYNCLVVIVTFNYCLNYTLTVYVTLVRRIIQLSGRLNKGRHQPSLLADIISNSLFISSANY